MPANLKVKVLKKTKDAPYPEHVIIDREDSSEGAHLYFDQGNLVKFVYMKRPQSPVQMEWNEEQKKYTIVPPPYQVEAAYDVFQNHYRPTPSFAQRDCTVPTSFCIFKVSNHWKESIVTFLDPNENRFAVVLDLQGKCKANQYMESWGAEVKTIYPHQKRRTCPTPSIIKKERT
ncbi:MAG: hypothetical protein IKQ99_01665 [Alphaproteobacteria bacterium]|nr:hypothetical protein [Alphaproteobacteria bacterium]